MNDIAENTKLTPEQLKVENALQIGMWIFGGKWDKVLPLLQEVGIETTEENLADRIGKHNSALMQILSNESTEAYFEALEGVLEGRKSLNEVPAAV